MSNGPPLATDAGQVGGKKVVEHLAARAADARTLGGAGVASSLEAGNGSPAPHFEFYPRSERTCSRRSTRSTQRDCVSLGHYQ